MEQSERAQAVLAWRESLLTMNDTHFFELLRMYLGEIKTPFNKQKLIEELSAFLRKDENVNVIVSLLSPNDILILSAIKILASPTQEKLSQFFSTDFSFAELYERLLNLEERLLIYRKTEQKQIRFVLNPLLMLKIEPLLSGSLLLPSRDAPPAKVSAFDLSATFLASVFSFFFHQPDLYKNDGLLKKKGENLMQSAFPFTKQKDGKNFFFLVFEGLKNLKLLMQTETSLTVNVEQWEQFANLNDVSRACYLCAASCGRFTNETLQKYAQLVLSICSIVPDGGFSYPVLMRASLLESEKTTESRSIKKSRLASLLQDIQPAKNENSTPANSAENSSLNVELSKIVQQIINMGLLVESDGVFVKSAFFSAALYEAENNFDAQNGSSLKGRLSLNADFSAALLPGAGLKDLLPLMQVLSITRFDTMPVFEISRQSCSAAFDKGFSSEKIKSILKDALSYEISQSVDFSLDDWERTYNSVALYKGYVLKIDREKRAVIENSKVLAPYVLAVLAEDVYLFNFADDEEAREVLKKSGLEYVGAVKTKKPVRHPLPFMMLSCGTAQKIAEPERTVLSKNERDSVLDAFYAELENRNFSDEQIDGLKSRIRRKVIVNAVQLRAESVRFERIEASGMDFLGKIHVIEHAISTDSMIEIAFDDESERIVGTPVGLEKHEGEAILKLCVEPEKALKLFSVSKVGYVKRIRGAIFKEL